jgi:hypothetical protein
VGGTFLVVGAASLLHLLDVVNHGSLTVNKLELESVVSMTWDLLHSEDLNL